MRLKFRDIINKWLPPHKRNPIRKDYLFAVANDLETLNASVGTVADEVSVIVKGTSQSLHLEYILNSIFDPGKRRIKVLTDDSKFGTFDVSLSIVVSDHILLNEQALNSLLYQLLFAGIKWTIVRTPIVQGGTFEGLGIYWVTVTNTGPSKITYEFDKLFVHHGGASLVVIENRKTIIEPFTCYKLTMEVKTSTVNVVRIKVYDSGGTSIDATTGVIGAPTTVVRSGISGVAGGSKIQLEFDAAGGGDHEIAEVRVDRIPYLFEWDFKNGLGPFVLDSPSGTHTAVFDKNEKALKLTSASGASGIVSLFYVDGIVLKGAGKKYHAYITIGTSTDATNKVAVALSRTDSSMTLQGAAGTYISRNDLIDSVSKTKVGIRFVTNQPGSIFIYKIGIVSYD